MVDTKFFHPSDRVSVTILRMGSRNAEFYVHMSEKDIKRLMKFAKKKQVKLSAGGAFRWSGPFKIISTSIFGKPKKKATKPKPAPPIPRVSVIMAHGKPKTKTKQKRTGKLSKYNLFVKKHRLAGKSMKQIGAMWRKKKR
jgi:hypothetical protein